VRAILHQSTAINGHDPIQIPPRCLIINREARHPDGYNARKAEGGQHQSGEVDYTGSIFKCGDRRVPNLLYERHAEALQGALKLKEWALAIARRSTLRNARIALAPRYAIMHAVLRHGTESKPA